MKRGNNPPDQPGHRQGPGSDRKSKGMSSASTAIQINEYPDDNEHRRDRSHLDRRGSHLLEEDHLHDELRGETVISHEGDDDQEEDQDPYKPRPNPDDPDRNPPDPYPEDDSEESDSDASKDPEDEEEKKRLAKEHAMVSLGHVETVRGAV